MAHDNYSGRFRFTFRVSHYVHFAFRVSSISHLCHFLVQHAKQNGCDASILIAISYSFAAATKSFSSYLTAIHMDKSVNALAAIVDQK